MNELLNIIKIGVIPSESKHETEAVYIKPMHTPPNRVGRCRPPTQSLTEVAYYKMMCMLYALARVLVDQNL